MKTCLKNKKHDAGILKISYLPSVASLFISKIIYKKQKTKIIIKSSRNTNSFGPKTPGRQTSEL